MWRGPATPSGDEELGADFLISSLSAKNPFKRLVVGPPREAVAVARRIGGVAVSDFSGAPPDLYRDVYAVHASGDLGPLMAGADVVVYIEGPIPPPRGVRVIALTCARRGICEEADCVCGGALRI
ncbi:hypothetical protein TUZN_1340 [Thermoproteus uzoniensis 768-20]|uniref:Uncharacterized protein n=1 Tax=Thermoproteus uzoniensis (strain 768-20) TaxID=999630 RepID=F2L180_THEU7|nr:hypothetical protein [Thermoproteus uzoniensis]AEA12816.1 hypothetical protein TUZN_1340 [Thermoproteus uzoniensis 768-20]